MPVMETYDAYIYGLVDPRDGEVRYIGKSVRPWDRLSAHMNEAPSNCHRSHWIQELKALGLVPDLVIFEAMRGEWSWQDSERYWIARGRALGWRLTNNTSGGDGVPNLPPETRARMAATWKGRKHKPETIEKLRAAGRKRVVSAETRAKMSKTQTGRVITWGAKLSEANRKLTEEQEATIRARLKAGERVGNLAKEFGMHRTSISKVKMGTYRKSENQGDLFATKESK